MSNNNNITFVCKVYNQTFKDVDEFRCNVTKLAAVAFYSNFGYICIGLICIIILISLFGRIKENYRWFILNQAFWDILLCYGFACENYFFLRIGNSKQCIWTASPTSPSFIFTNIFYSIMLTTPYSASFLLSASRFFALYKTNIYAKLTKPKNLFLTFFIFYFFIIFFCCSYGIFSYLATSRGTEAITSCLNQGKNSSICSNAQYSDALFSIYFKLFFVAIVVTALIPKFSLLFSIFASIMIILRLIKQAKFQWKHNRKDLYNSARICAVIFFQSFLNFFVLCLQIFGPLLHTISSTIIGIFPLQIVTTYRTYGLKNPENTVIKILLPLWLSGYWGLATDDALQVILQCRIFIESFIILFVMTGYREALWKFLKYLFFTVKNPKQFWNETLHNKTSVVVLSSS